MIHLQGCKVVHCEERLRLGSHVILSMRVFIRPGAFVQKEVVNQDEVRNVWNEGQETETEKMLRNRMASLLEMFRILGLQPKKKAALSLGSLPRSSELDSSEAMEKLALHSDAKAAGSDEEAEELDENQLDMIYHKYICYSMLGP